MTKLISWNVNGLRACMQKGFLDFFIQADADVFCIQESKLQAGQIDLQLEGYHQYWNYAVKKGYSGTAIFTKQEPLSVTYGIGIPEHDQEGRVITAEFADYYVVTCYTPNSQDGLKRLDYRMEWENVFLAYLKKLEETKPVIFCGDLNVAHREIDLKIQKPTAKTPASPTRREESLPIFWRRALSTHSAISTRTRRASIPGGPTALRPGRKNAGWRIDYFCVSESLKDRLESAAILTDIMGSDHCPVELVIR